VAKAKSDEGTAPNRGPATKTASAPRSRRDKLASLEAARKKEQRSRTIKLLVICLVLAIALLAYPVYLFVDDYRARNASIEHLGSSIAAAGCDPIAEHEATGNQDHVAEGTKVDYAQTPPDSGKHYPSPAPFTKHFYAEADRPPVETLVHNLEHGYTVVWYRADAPGKQIKNLQRIAKTFGSDDYDPADKFIAAPWSEADGAGFPAGKNVVITRWTADPNDPGNPTAQKGVRQACTEVSGAAIKDFMAKYPVANSPEPSGA
jgi:flagellar basal body-associated protein FliL